MNLQKYYFSFGLGHELKDYYQPIMAVDEITAIEKMHEIYGDRWAHVYEESQWVQTVMSKTKQSLGPIQVLGGVNYEDIIA